MKEQILNEVSLRDLWSSERVLTFRDKLWRVHKMCCGTYFLEPSNCELKETDGFHKDTLWLERNKDTPFFFEVTK